MPGDAIGALDTGRLWESCDFNQNQGLAGISGSGAPPEPCNRASPIASEPPHVVASDCQVVHGHWRLSLHRELDVLHVHIHGHVDALAEEGSCIKETVTFVLAHEPLALYIHQTAYTHIHMYVSLYLYIYIYIYRYYLCIYLLVCVYIYIFIIIIIIITIIIIAFIYVFVYIYIYTYIYIYIYIYVYLQFRQKTSEWVL